MGFDQGKQIFLKVSLVNAPKHRHHLLNRDSILSILVIVEEKEDKHTNCRDEDLFVLVVFAHDYDSLSQGVAHIDLPLVLMLLVVENLEVLHLRVDFRWQLHVNRHVMWPIHTLQSIQ